MSYRSRKGTVPEFLRGNQISQPSTQVNLGEKPEKIVEWHRAKVELRSHLTNTLPGGLQDEPIDTPSHIELKSDFSTPKKEPPNVSPTRT